MLAIEDPGGPVRVRPILVVSILALCAHSASAQALTRYRDFVLTSDVASVLKTAGGRETDVRTTRERPARIREIEWRTPYVAAGAGRVVDPVHDVLFSFYNDKLYRIAVSYARERVEGMTTADFVDSLSKTYGVTTPAAAHGAVPIDVAVDATVVARWEDADSLLTLTRGTYSGQFQVVLVSKTLNDSARAALKEAARLDTQEAPQRALDLLKQEEADGQKTRDANKAGFRP